MLITQSEVTTENMIWSISSVLLKVCVYKSKSIPRDRNPSRDFSLYTHERNCCSWRWNLGHCGVRTAIRGTFIMMKRLNSTIMSSNQLKITEDLFFSQGGDVISTILRREFTYDQKQGTCAEVRGHQRVFCLIVQIHKHLCFILTEHLCYYSILVLPMPTAQQTPTVSRERWTLMATVWFSFSNSAQAMLVHSYYITLISTYGTLSYRQKNWQMCSIL